MGVKGVKKKYMGRESQKNEVVKWAGMVGMLANKLKRGKNVESGPRKP